ncbi:MULTISPECIES: antiterminator Q family protein [Pseudomonas]|uniref:Antitermination protein Q n=1 Tax=Pseudomonas paralactis TaxID=1615673 RepID=A0A0R3AVT5_9PSED|nr:MULTISPECIES: antiterminator Q family protein [Pseudomonas]KRP74843.1 antitermination protein Q [Pseudomonas paralactis]MBV4480530.1 antitermination protein Q [Pseudomonas khavaziana]
MKKRTYVDKPLGDTEYLLEQWGWWRMDGMGVPRYVSPLLALMRDNVQMPSTASYVITDDLALAVDSAMAKLTRRNEQMGLFLWLYFGAKWTMVRIGESGKMSERSAREIIKAGVGWIDGVLQGMSEAA